MDSPDFQIHYSQLQLVPPFLALFGCIGAGLFEIGLSRNLDSVSSGFRALAGFLVPPAVYFVVGVGISDWPLASPSGPSAMLGHASLLLLGAGILTRSLRHQIRIQPLLIGLSVMGAFLLPLVLALEHFLKVFHTPFHDEGHLGLISLVSAAFASSYFIRPKASLPSQGCEGDNPGLAILGVVFLLWAWVMGGLCEAVSAEDMAHRIVCMLVASATSFFALVSGSMMHSGTIPQRNIVLAPLSGLIACLPVASTIAIQTSAVAGLVGALFALGCDWLLRRAALDDLGGSTAAHFGGGVAGMVVSPFLVVGPSLGQFGLQAGLTLICAAMSFLIGHLVWTGLGFVVRLAPSADEMEIGLDFTEHGCKRRI